MLSKRTRKTEKRDVHVIVDPFAHLTRRLRIIARLNSFDTYGVKQSRPSGEGHWFRSKLSQLNGYWEELWGHRSPKRTDALGAGQ